MKFETEILTEAQETQKGTPNAENGKRQDYISNLVVLKSTNRFQMTKHRGWKGD